MYYGLWFMKDLAVLEFKLSPAKLAIVEKESAFLKKSIDDLSPSQQFVLDFLPLLCTNCINCQMYNFAEIHTSHKLQQE